MDNYFDMLGQNVPNEEKKEESQEMVNLTVRADAECAVFCDGDFLFTLEAGKLEKTQAPAGQHLLEFKSLEDDNIVVEKEVDFSDVKKNYLVIVRELSALIEQKKAEEAAKKAAKEAAKRKEEAEAKRKAEAEAKRKAEEEAKRKAEAEAKRKAEEVERKKQEAYENIRKGKEYINTKQYSSAVSHLIEGLAIVSDPEAQYELGLCYAEGRGVIKDEDQAVFWCRKAAEQGYAKAQHHLAYYLHFGIGVAKNLSEALELYRKASEQGYGPASTSLGIYYDNRAYFGHCGYNEGLKWFRKGAAQGDAPSMEYLGRYYFYGKGVVKDESKALYYSLKAFNLGYMNALEVLKELAKKNYAEAKKFFDANGNLKPEYYKKNR